MSLIISILVVASLILGMLFDYVMTLNEQNQIKNNKKKVRLQAILFRGKKLLNGSSILPLTATSSVVCLERTLAAIDGLLKLQSTTSRLAIKVDLENKLDKFRALPAIKEHFYALLSVPNTEQEQLIMLKQSMLLVMFLKSKLSKGYSSIGNIHADINHELNQLVILNARLKSAAFNLQAMIALESKLYDKGLTLSNKAIALLAEIKCADENVTELVNDTIEEFKLINIGISAVIEEKSHDFYEKYKKDTRQTGNNEDDSSDGLEKIFSKS